MRAVIFDTETTNLTTTRLLPLKEQPEIVELYAALVALETGEIESEVHSFFKPSRFMTDENVKIHRITNESVENAPRFAEKAEEIRVFFERAPLVIAHNASFDVEMVDIEFERLKGKVKWPRVICAVEATVHIKGFRLSLTNLHEFLFGEPFADAHRADIDTKALIRVCVELYKRDWI